MEELLFDLSAYLTLASPDDYPKTKSSKNFRRNKNAPTTKHANNYTSSLTLKGHLCQVTMILHLGEGTVRKYYKPRESKDRVHFIWEIKKINHF
jgi:hypothetical protein